MNSNFKDTEENPYNRRGFIALAESYGHAAWRLVETGDLRPFNYPIVHLACHCVELSLKAVLLANGATEKDLLAHRHGLAQLFRATGLDWSDIDQETIEFYDKAVRSNLWRYKSDRQAYIADPEHALSLAEVVFHRCLQRVLPGARRTLRR